MVTYICKVRSMPSATIAASQASISSLTYVGSFVLGLY